MTDFARSPGRPVTHAPARVERLGRIRFDLAYALLAAWLVGGLYLDGWAHTHLAETLESFLTPWHAVFYAGFAATAALLLAATVRRHGADRVAWSAAAPAGYAPSLAGIALFATGGVADSVWHTLFGIETSVDALVSPPHLVLALGLGLIVSGPLTAAWRRVAALDAVTVAALTVSLALTLSLLTFFTQFANPFVEAWATESNLREHAPLLGGLPATLTDDVTPVIGVTAILLQAALLVGILLPVVGRWQLPFGTITVVVTLNVLLVSFIGDQQRLLPAAVVAGLVGDLLVQRLRPAADPRGLVVLATALPAVLYAAYFATLLVLDRVIWPGTLAVGTIALAGIVGGMVGLAFSARRRAEA